MEKIMKFISFIRKKILEDKQEQDDLFKNLNLVIPQKELEQMINSWILLVCILVLLFIIGIFWRFFNYIPQ